MSNMQFIESNMQKLMRFNYNQLSQPRKENEHSPRGDKVFDFSEDLNLHSKDIITNNKDILNN